MIRKTSHIWHRFNRLQLCFIEILYNTWTSDNFAPKTTYYIYYYGMCVHVNFTDLQFFF